MSPRFTKDSLKGDGFAGFETVRSLHASRCVAVPKIAGVYVVVRAATTPPRFLKKSVGGRFKGSDPTVAVSVLKPRWIGGTAVIYIGMAGSDLRERVRALVDFGTGKNIGHKGGRYLWQLQGSASFLLAWKPEPRARRLEATMLRDFESGYSRLPFANIAH